jgi:hypothetical protein
VKSPDGPDASAASATTVDAGATGVDALTVRAAGSLRDGSAAARQPALSGSVNTHAGNRHNRSRDAQSPP